MVTVDPYYWLKLEGRLSPTCHIFVLRSCDQFWCFHYLDLVPTFFLLPPVFFFCVGAKPKQIKRLRAELARASEAQLPDLSVPELDNALGGDRLAQWSDWKSKGLRQRKGRFLGIS